MKTKENKTVKEYLFLVRYQDKEIDSVDVMSSIGLLPTIKELSSMIERLCYLKNNFGSERIEKHNKKRQDILEEYQRNISQETNTFQENKKQLGYIYIIKADKYYKIGKAKEPYQRIDSFMTSNPFEIKTILIKLVSDYTKVERMLHRKYKEKLFRSEWFVLDAEDLHKIETILNRLEIKNQKTL